MNSTATGNNGGSPEISDKYGPLSFSYNKRQGQGSNKKSPGSAKRVSPQGGPESGTPTSGIVRFGDEDADGDQSSSSEEEDCGLQRGHHQWSKDEVESEPEVHSLHGVTTSATIGNDAPEAIGNRYELRRRSLGRTPIRNKKLSVYATIDSEDYPTDYPNSSQRSSTLESNPATQNSAAENTQQLMEAMQITTNNSLDLDREKTKEDLKTFGEQGYQTSSIPLQNIATRQSINSEREDNYYF